LTPYITNLQSKHLIARKENDGGMNDFTAERIFREFKRIEQGIKTLNTIVEGIKAKRSFFISGHSGDPMSAINTNNKVEPSAFGGTGMFLERFSNINRECFEADGSITGLKLYSALTMVSLAAGEIVNFKVGLKLEGANKTRFGPTHTIDGTVVTSTVIQTFTDCVDFSFLIPELQSGDFFLGIGAWVTGGPANQRVIIGGPYTALIVETEDG